MKLTNQEVKGLVTLRVKSVDICIVENTGKEPLLIESNQSYNILEPGRSCILNGAIPFQFDVHADTRNPPGQFNVMVSGNSEQGSYIQIIEPVQAAKPAAQKTCDCGAAAIKSNNHYGWCQLGGKNV